MYDNIHIKLKEMILDSLLYCLYNFIYPSLKTYSTPKRLRSHLRAFDHTYWLIFIFRIIALLGLFLISVGTGGIKPCVFTFGGDQFRLPEQEKQLLHYTTKFMFAINVGALFSTFLTPELRQSVHCLGRDTCFPLAFGVPAVLMLTAIGNYYHFIDILI